MLGAPHPGRVRFDVPRELPLVRIELSSSRALRRCALRNGCAFRVAVVFREPHSAFPVMVACTSVCSRNPALVLVELGSSRALRRRAPRNECALRTAEIFEGARAALPVAVACTMVNVPPRSAARSASLVRPKPSIAMRRATTAFSAPPYSRIRRSF